ncbi:MAG: STN domain-containing protein, partial [Sphingobacterium sp.]|nr:STN domain-containing protein [Sphingobacterium sp.]
MKSYLLLLTGVCLLGAAPTQGKMLMTVSTHTTQADGSALLVSLENIAKNANKRLVYDKEILIGKKAASYDKTHSLPRIMEQLLHGTGIAYQIKGDIILLHASTENLSPKVEKRSQSQQQAVLRGIVRDQLTRQPVSEA